MSTVGELLDDYRKRAQQFHAKARQLFAKFEQSTARVISVDETRKKIAGLSLQQNELLEQSIKCVEFEIYRAAHVMAWSALVDLVEEKLASDGLGKVKAARPAWSKFATIDEIRENLPEHQLVEVTRDVGLMSKSEVKSILGLLAKRNECAHPSGFRPGLNDSLGYVTDVLKRMEKLAQKTL